MIFNTISYLVFLVVGVASFWLLPKRYRLYLLLALSLLFYGLWRVEFIFLIGFSAFVDYYFSLKIHDSADPLWRKRYMWLSISTNIALLIYFKYTYFIVDNLAFMTGVSGAQFRASFGQIILPLGISFYTFLSISYTIDVYRRTFAPIRNFVHYLTYVMFWPHMIAGPILRPHELIPQLLNPPVPSRPQIAAALRAILFGLLLKVGVADNLAPLVDDAFAIAPNRLGGLDVWTMAFGFGLQIYCDFAGYSMIAIGSAALLGITFPQNFNWPYLASSPREFWRRWHITLSTWIRDYLYLPLSGVRHASQLPPPSGSSGMDIQFAATGNMVRATLALFVTWFVMGLWHGASWNFALWGLWHAVFIFAYRLIGPRLPELTTALGQAIGQLTGWGLTLAIAMLGWVPFRAPDVATTWALWGRLFDWRSYRSLGFRENLYLVVFCVFVGMLLLHWISRIEWTSRAGRMARDVGEVAAVAGTIFIVFIFLRPIAQFIYFQF
jgi:alginate O-acetyltransferase complex protein AlgI